MLKNAPPLFELARRFEEHAKGMVVDGRRAYIGSFNMNPWSFLFNTETGVIADDLEPAATD